MQRLIPIFTLAALGVAGCLGNTFTFTGSDGDGSLHASADITLSGNTATVVLHNLQTNVGAAGQLISGFGFVVKNSGGTVLTELGVVSETAIVRTLAADGDGDESFSDASPSTIDWSVQNNQGSTDCKGLVGIQLCALTGGSPDLMIIGPQSLDGDYSVNSSVFPNHQPDLSPDSATFVITLSGTGASVSSANFAFGTGSDFTSGNVVTPEPRWGALLLMIGGLAAIAIRRFKSIRA